MGKKHESKKPCSLRILNDQLNKAKKDNDTKMVRIIEICIKRILDKKLNS